MPEDPPTRAAESGHSHWRDYAHRVWVAVLLEQYGWGKSIVASLRQPAGFLSQAGGFVSKASSVFSITIKGVIFAWVRISTVEEPDACGVRGLLVHLPASL